MASFQKYLTPLSVVIAGGMVMVGLYFGLQSGMSTPQSLEVVSTPALDQARTSSMHEAPSDPDKAAVQEAASRELDRYRSEVVAKCVRPAMAVQPNPPHVKLTFNVTFDAAGKQLMRGIVEDRATSRPGVAMCAMDAVPALTVPPPGTNVRVDLAWTLP